MNQKETVKQILKYYERLLEPFEDQIILGHFYQLSRELYDPQFEGKEYQSAITELKRIIAAWEIIENKPGLNKEIRKSITLPLQFSAHGQQWVDPIDIKIASANAILIH